jgi:CheY-like chemotaxis protein
MKEHPGVFSGSPEGAGTERPAPILVVEDNPINQKVLATLLRKRGYEVDVANDGAQAVQKAAEKEYGLILMDLQMPVLDGYEAAKLIRSFTVSACPPIIAVTAHTLNSEKQQCLEAGMNGYLPKPVDSHKLIECVERCLRRA